MEKPTPITTPDIAEHLTKFRKTGANEYQVPVLDAVLAGERPITQEEIREIKEIILTATPGESGLSNVERDRLPEIEAVRAAIAEMYPDAEYILKVSTN